MNRPKVSVSLITYNHEKYIAECLDSLLDQQVSFDFEIVVADDCSVDRTPEIIKTYALKHPGIVKPILRENNLGMVKNALATIQACTGEYIAIMEGDDFWTNEHKLQTQADYLDNNPDCVLCFTNGYSFYEDVPGKKQFFFTEKNEPPEKLDLDFFIKNNVTIPNNTKMFRSVAQPGFFPEWIYRSINWDWVLHILQSPMGKFGYIDLVTLAYRRHAAAAFISQSEKSILQNGITTMTELNKYLDYSYDSIFRNMWWEYRELSFIYLRERDLISFFTFYTKYLIAVGTSGELKIRDDLWKIRKAIFGKKDK